MNKAGSRTREYVYTKIFLCCVLIVCTLFCRALADDKAVGLNEDCGLQIYLPREVTIRDGNFKLGQIGIIRGEKALATRANEIALGRFSLPGQEIVIERHIILSRLASCGIPSSQVTLQGAEKVTVRQRQKIIIGAEFVRLAGAFLENSLSDKSISQWSPICKPKDLVVPGSDKDIRFSHQLVPGDVKNQVKVEIAVFFGDEQIGTREVTFSIQYNSHNAVTLVEIPAGALISRENIKIEKSTSNYPEPDDWEPPYGQVARRTLPAETVLKPHMVGPVESPVIIKRNQNVVIRIQKPGFLITAVGKAMQDGKVGEYIKVRNIDSQRIILGRVNQDRSVEPVI